jgi:hypothetical protein
MAASEMPFRSAIVANVWLEHVRRHLLGDAGAPGDAFDDLLYLARTNEPALIQGEVRNHSGNWLKSGSEPRPFDGVILD